MPADPVAVVLDQAAVKAAVAEALADALDRLDKARSDVGDGRLAYSEPEAARLIGLHSHQLRDERRRGRIVGSVIVGRQTRYTRSDLMAYLARNRTDAP